MSEPTALDQDGCPTDETLERIKQWSPSDPVGLFEFVEQCWSKAGRFVFADNTVQMSTGGWSGNEDVIDALQRNCVAWSLCWVMSRAGGGYEFEIPVNFHAEPTP